MLLTIFAPLSTAEQKFIDELTGPARIVFAGGDLPDDDTDDCSLRAGLIRAVLMDTDSDLDQKGLRLRGAWIKGALDLQGMTCGRDLTFSNCHFTDAPGLVNARLRGLHFSGCHLPGFSADNARFAGSLYLRDNCRITGEISLAGARIENDVQLCGVEIISTGQDAVFAPGLCVEGSVYLGDYPFSDRTTTLVTEGSVFLSSARIGHDFFVTNCAISPQTGAVANAVFDATEEHGNDIGLSLARAQIGGILYFRDNQITRGIVNLAGASVARLKDEPIGPGAAWPIRLDGFTYKDFSRHTDTTIAARLAWLARRPAGMPFSAQPYEQLAQVLKTLGHRADAKTVLMRKENLLRCENRQSLRRAGNWFRWAFSAISEPVLRFTVGYGYRPGRALFVATVMILLLGWFFDRAWDAGDMAPNAAPVLVSAPWIAATETHADNPAAFWSSPGQAGQDYETFQPFAYAADLMVPLVNLGQEAAWAPSTSRSSWGWHGWWIRWFAKVAGWVITALAAAALTGMIRNE